jgi:hypothetical protein
MAVYCFEIAYISPIKKIAARGAGARSRGMSAARSKIEGVIDFFAGSGEHALGHRLALKAVGPSVEITGRSDAGLSRFGEWW